MTRDQELDLLAYSRRLGGAVTIVAALLVTLVASQVLRRAVLSSARALEREKVSLLRELVPLPASRFTPGADPAPLRAALSEWLHRAGWLGLLYVGRLQEPPIWIETGEVSIPERVRQDPERFVSPQLLRGEPGVPSPVLGFRADLIHDLSQPEFIVAFRASEDIDHRLGTLQIVIFCVISGTLGMLFAALISVVGRGEVLRRAADARAEALRRANEETHAMLVQAAKMTALGELAAGVAHEINNPVAVVSNALELMADLPAAKQPDLKQGLTDIGDAAERIRRIVRDLSSFSAPQPTEMGPVALKPVLERTLELARLSSATRAHVEIVARIPADLPPVRAQEGPLHQVFLNLLVNARYAVTRMPRTEGDPPRVELSVRRVDGPAGARVEVEVSDNGPGIAPDHLSRIFEPFFTTKPRAEGTGLGLWVSHRIVTSHRGSIRVTSAPGQGTQFTVDLPVCHA